MHKNKRRRLLESTCPFPCSRPQLPLVLFARVPRLALACLSRTRCAPCRLYAAPQARRPTSPARTAGRATGWGTASTRGRRGTSPSLPPPSPSLPPLPPPTQGLQPWTRPRRDSNPSRHPRRGSSPGPDHAGAPTLDLPTQGLQPWICPRPRSTLALALYLLPPPPSPSPYLTSPLTLPYLTLPHLPRRPCVHVVCACDVLVRLSALCPCLCRMLYAVRVLPLMIVVGTGAERDGRWRRMRLLRGMWR